MKDKFTENIKKQLKEHRIAPPEMAWQTISTTLNQQPTKSVWKRLLSTAAILALPLSFAAIMFYYFQPNEVPSYTQNTKTTNRQTRTEDQDTQTNKLKNEITPPNSTEKEEVAFSKQTSFQPQSSPKIVKAERRVNTPLKEKNKPIAKEQTKPQNTPPNRKNYEQKQNMEIAEIQIKEEQEDLAIKKKRLQITFSPYTGINNIMSLNDVNLISSEMNKYAMTNKIAMTYGSKIDVQVTPRLQLRSGIGVLNIKQDTHDITLTMFAENVSQNSNLSPTSDINIKATNYQPIAFRDEVKSSIMMQQTLSYELQFIEIPLEVEYTIFQTSKFDFSTTTGLSTLLRNKNSIYMNGNQEFAKSTNINKASFSANVGVKFNYELNSNLSVNLEPQVKYLFNTITNNDEIHPYIVGINFGFSWKLLDK